MRRFFIGLHDQAFSALQDLAIRERRDVRDQAACVLENALAPRSGSDARQAPPPPRPAAALREASDAGE